MASGPDRATCLAPVRRLSGGAPGRRVGRWLVGVAVVLALTPAPLHAQTGTTGVPPKDQWTCPGTHPIKAVVTPRTKECVYQRPEDQYYAPMRPEMCFRSEEEAQREDCWRANEIL